MNRLNLFINLGAILLLETTDKFFNYNKKSD